MRLLEFPCGRRATPPEETTPKPTATVEEPEVAGCASPDKRRRRAAPSWRPSLVSISEDGAAPVATPSQPSLAAKGGGSGKGKAKAKAEQKPDGRVLPRAAADDYHQHYGVVPTFAPTAFFF